MHSRADLLLGMPRPATVAPPPRRTAPARTRRTPHFRGSRSGYMGVIFCPYLKINQWKAYLRHHGQYVTLGYFPTKEAAALAYNAEAVRLFGHGTPLNQVPDQPSS